MKWLLYAWKNVLRNRRRAGITVVLATLGTASVLLASGFALSTYAMLETMSAGEIGHVVIAHRDYFDGDEEVPLGHGLGKSEALRAELLKDPRIAAVNPRLHYSGLISNGEMSAIFIGTGVDAAGEFDVNRITVEHGRSLSLQETAEAESEVMLARELARHLKAKVGDSLTLLSTTADGALNGIDVQVVGIYGTGTPEMDERALLTGIDTAQALLRSNKVSTLSVYLTALEGAHRLRDELAQGLPDLGLRTWDELAAFYTKVKNLYDRIFGVLGIIIVAMVFFAVANTMSMSVAERTREIGTLAALGTSARRIVVNFAMESGLLGLISALLGVLLAGLVSLLFEQFPVMMPPPPGRTEGYPLLFQASPELYLIVALVIFFTAVLAAWVAARRGVGKPIVEALQHV